MTSYHVLGGEPATAVTAVAPAASAGASQDVRSTQNTGGSAKRHGVANPALFFCSGLFGGGGSDSGGVLDSVLSVAPLSTGAADAKSEVQFSQIWSTSHQATVGRHRDPLSKPLVADVKLPIAFSAADRKRFEDAGWKPRPGAIGPVTSYCLESGGSREAGMAAPTRGLFCVTGGP